MTKEASVTTFLQVKKLKQDDQLSSKTYQSSSRGQWSTTYNYGDSKNDEDNNNKKPIGLLNLIKSKK